jgi:hypothetical protein
MRERMATVVPPVPCVDSTRAGIAHRPHDPRMARGGDAVTTPRRHPRSAHISTANAAAAAGDLDRTLPSPARWIVAISDERHHRRHWARYTSRELAEHTAQRLRHLGLLADVENDAPAP